LNVAGTSFARFFHHHGSIALDASMARRLRTQVFELVDYRKEVLAEKYDLRTTPTQIRLIPKFPVEDPKECGDRNEPKKG
jgi:hypothetical protein